MQHRILAFTAVAVAALAPELRARGDWGPGECAIVFSEVHYHPPRSASTEEYLELYNRGVHWVDLSGWRFTDGIEFTIPDETWLAPGEYLVVARDRAALSRAVGGARIVGDYDGALRDSGEIIELRNRSGRVITWLHYLDGKGPEGGLWPESPDGDGPSLELIDAHPDWQRPWYWSPSRVPGGTPGRENTRHVGLQASPAAIKAREARESLTINEVRLEEPGSFVELWNAGGRAVSLEGLKLTRHLRGRGGVDLSGSAGRGGLHVVTAEKLETIRQETSPVLFLLDAGSLEIVDSLKMGPRSPPGGSFGRYPRGSGRVSALPEATPGRHNVAPEDVPVVINEIHYHGYGDDEGEEFIELHNTGRETLGLEGWSLGGGVAFRFPDEASIPGGGYVVVTRDPAKLTSTLEHRAESAQGGKVFAGLEGRLSNSGETIRLEDSWGNLVDKVRYSDRPPWPRGADGGGFSLELLHPALDNSFPQAWTLGRPGGSPGASNSRRVRSMKPVIGGVSHDPPVPGPGDRVLIHAHVLDTGSLSRVAIVYREVTGGASPKTRSLSDSGRLEDGAARDGHYTTRLPAFRAGTVVGFSILAQDSSGRTGRAPANPAREYYFQVEPRSSDAEERPGMPCYRVVLPPEDWDRFMRSPRREDNWFECTLVASIEGRGVNRRRGRVYYGAEIRYRGNNSRNPPDGRMSYRIRLAGGDIYDGRDRFILNAFKPLHQKAGGDILRSVGIPVSDATVVRLKTPTFDDRRYVDVEVVNNEFLDKKLGSSSGDVFRGRRGRPFGADLSYHGSDPEPYLDVYQRMNRKGDESIPRLLELLRALDTEDHVAYAEEVRKRIDAVEWALYFAANNALGNTEGGLSTGQADDYFLAERPSDGRFLLVPWDQDSTFDRETLDLFPRRLPTTHRLLTHAAFAPLYHRGVRELLDGPLAPGAFASWTRRFEGLFAREDLEALRSFVRRRQIYLRQRMPSWPRVGIRRTEDPMVGAGAGLRALVPPYAGPIALVGYVDPAVTFGVRLEEQQADYDPERGLWTLMFPGDSLSPGSNALWISCLGATGDVVALHSLNLEQVPSFREVPAVIRSDSRWVERGVPRVLRGRTTVPPGVTLEIGPGVQVLCDPETILEVRGRLEAVGTPREPVTFSTVGDGQRTWRGLHLHRTGTGNLSPLHRLRCCRFEGGSGAESGDGDSPASTDGSFLTAEGVRLAVESCLFRGVAGTAVALRGSSAELRDVTVVDSTRGLSVQGGHATLEDIELRTIHSDGLELVGLDREGSGVRGGVLREVLGKGVRIRGGHPELERLLIHGSEVGVEVSGGARVVIDRSTLVSIDRAIVVDPSPASDAPAGPSPRSSRLELRACVIGPCLLPLVATRGSRVEATGCLFPPQADEALLPREGDNVFTVARFVAPQKGDFRLRDDSPARDPEGAVPGYRGTPWPGGSR